MNISVAGGCCGDRMIIDDSNAHGHVSCWTLMHVSNQMKTFECHGMTVVRGEKPEPKIKMKTSEKSSLHVVNVTAGEKAFVASGHLYVLNCGRQNYEKHTYAVCRLHQTNS